MASRLVVLSQRLTSAVQAGLSVFRREVTPLLDARVAPFLAEGETGFDFLLLQRVLGRMIAASRDRLIAADKANIDELSDDVAPRSVRDDVVDAVRQKLIDIRRIAEVLFGTVHAVEIVAVDGSTALQPEFLWRQAEHTLSRLRAPDLRLPAPSTSALSFDPLTFADELEPLVTALRQAIDGVEVDRREAAVSVEAKHEAMAEHDQLIGACGRILVGFYRLAGRPDLADRMRLSLPRRARRTQTGDACPRESWPVPWPTVTRRR